MKLIVCSSVLADTFNYSNDPRMWHRYVLELFNIFCWISPKLLLPLMYVVLDGPILYLHKWLFWYMEFHLIWSVFYAYLWWSTAVLLSLHKALSVTATLRPQESLYSNIAEASYYITNDWKINRHMMTTALHC